MTQRDDFSAATKKLLAEFANYRCCICNVATTGPGSQGPIRSHRAAHISGAAPGGPRYRAELTKEQRSGADNGLHLCANHADIVDDDEVNFTEARLREIRAAHHARIAEEQQGVRLADAFASSTTDIVRHWPTTISGLWLPRPELDEVAEHLAISEGKGVVILGAPGSGKSALLAKLVPALEARGTTVFGLRLDALPRDIASQADLGRWAGVASTVAARLHREATQRDVVLVVDQLDQLSELVDRDTRRLEVVLACLAEAATHPRVRIVCACREFDFNRDARFRRLAAGCITLPVLPSASVHQVLTANGVEAARLPPPLLEVLSVPQHLKVFVELLKVREDLLGPYHQMLEEVWKERVGTPARSSAASRLANLIAEHEAAYVPLARFDDVRRGLDDLVRDGIAAVQGLAVGFTHQTIFDFARARAFVAEQGDLETYVLEHQRSVFVRPVLWNALQYMRVSHAPEYKDVLPRLFDGERIRDHVRTLVAEFLGQLRDPDPDERSLLRGVLENAALRRAFLGAVGANSPWLSSLGRGRVRDLMRSHGTQVVPILRAALEEHCDEVLELVIECGWFERDDTAPAATDLLRHVGEWTSAATSLLRLGICAGRIEGYDLGGFLEAMAKTAPDGAVDLLREAMQRTLAGEKSGEDERQRARAALALAVDALSDERGLAAAAPRAVMELLRVLPTLLRPEEEGRQRPSHFRWPWALAYPDDELLVLFKILCDASVALAAMPEVFLKAAAGIRDVDCDSVQAVLAHGFGALAPSHIQHAVQFIVEDPRRVCIAGRGFPDLVTIELLEKLSPNLSPTDVARLEAWVHGSAVYNAAEGDVEQRRYRLKSELERRSGLLMVLPRPHLSRRSLEHLSSFPAESPKPDVHQVFEFSSVPGPMSADQMGRARDAHLLNLFDELTDDTGWEHPRHRLRGGSVEAARALKELSKRDPARTARLLASLEPGFHERPVGYALEGLAEAEWDAPSWSALVLQSEERGFRSHEYRLAVADAVHTRAQRGYVDTRLLTLLENWLDTQPDDALPDSDDDDFFGAPPRIVDGDRPRPICGGGLGGALPEGPFRILRALELALVREETRDMARWLGIVERHLGRGRSRGAVRCWRAMARSLHYLKWCDDDLRVLALFRDLFAVFPDVLVSEGGARLLFRLVHWAPVEDLSAWMEQLRRQDARFAKQLAGEVLAACDLAGRLPGVALRRLRDAEDDEAVGILLRASEWWSEDEVRRGATDLLVAGAAAGGRVGWSSARALERRAIIVDDFTCRLVRAILDSSSTAVLPSEFLEDLDQLAPEAPALALEVAQRTLDVLQAGQAQLIGWFGVGPALISVALTLQRMTGFREEGMALFERLLGLEVFGVRDALSEIDRRPGVAPAMSPRRRRGTATPRRRRGATT